MFHGVAYNGGNAKFDKQMAQEYLDGLRADEARIAEIMVERTGLTSDQLGLFAKRATTMNATEAVRDGIVHRIRNVEIPPDALVIPVGRPQ
jgi:ATP-dependent protease ClpP protease subunit